MDYEVNLGNILTSCADTSLSPTSRINPSKRVPTALHTTTRSLFTIHVKAQYGVRKYYSYITDTSVVKK